MERLVIFAKPPVAGLVKTRLALSPEHSAAIHEAFLRDIVARHSQTNRRTELWRGNQPDHPIWAELGLPQYDQPPLDLGQRMASALQKGVGNDAKVVVIGSDSPTLPLALIDEAFAALDRAPVVLGPACDGGYYLVGMRGQVAPIFPSGMPWGTHEVLDRTLFILQSQGITFELLDFWYDVDRPADLRYLVAHLAILARQGDTEHVHTRKVLDRLAPYFQCPVPSSGTDQ